LLIVHQNNIIMGREKQRIMTYRRVLNLSQIAIIISLGVFLTGCNSEKEEIEPYVIPDNVIQCETHIADVYGGADAIVTLISDDGFYDSGCNFNSLLDERNLRGTVAGAVCYVEPNLDGWIDILNDGNVELVNHSYNHIKMDEGSFISVNYFSLLREIVSSDTWYEDTFGDEQIVFVCPENRMCRLGYSILENNDFWAVRRGNRGYNSLSPDEGTEPGQWFNLMVQGICDEGVNTESRNDWIDQAVNQHLWLIEMWHNVMPEDDGFYQTISILDAAEHLDYIQNEVAIGEIWNATFSEAVKYIREVQNAEVIAFVQDTELHVYVSLGDENMRYDTFNQPLTVFIQLPSEYELNGERNVTLDVVPGQEVIVEVQK